MQKVEDIVTSNPKWNAKTELTFSSAGNASSQLFESGVRGGGGGGGAAEEVSTSTRGCAGPRAIRLTAYHPHHQPAVAPKPVAAEAEVRVCCGVARVG